MTPAELFHESHPDNERKETHRLVWVWFELLVWRKAGGEALQNSADVVINTDGEGESSVEALKVKQWEIFNELVYMQMCVGIMIQAFDCRCYVFYVYRYLCR